MVSLQFNIPDYASYLDGDIYSGFGAGVRRQIVLSLAEDHVRFVEDEAKASAPSDSGRLRASIRARLLSERLGVLEATVPYARYLHEGTGVYGLLRKPIVIEPKEKKALTWTGATHPVRRVRQRGIKPNDFLRMSVQNKRVEDRMRLMMKTLLMNPPADSNSWYKFWNWGEFGEDVAHRSANSSGGFADTVTSVFGLTGFIGRNLYGTDIWDHGVSGRIRLLMGTDQYVDKCSGYYTSGTVAADAWLMALSGGIGASQNTILKTGMNRPNPAFPRGIEWVERSHWIPKRILPEFLKNAEWNMKRVWGTEHALIDPKRYRLLRKWWKDENKIYNPLRRQWLRIPYWLQGSLIGASISGTSRALIRNNDDCEQSK